MKDCEICEYIRCPYFKYYKSIGFTGRCYAIGACVKIRDTKRRWRISPMSRPGIHFTEDEKRLIQCLANEDSYAAQSVILAKIADAANDLSIEYGVDLKTCVKRLEKALRL